MTVAPETDTESTADELVLEPPKPVGAVGLDRAAASIKVDDATAAKIEAAVTRYVLSTTK